MVKTRRLEERCNRKPDNMTYRDLVLGSFGKFQRGRLRVSLPDGTTKVFGGLGRDLEASLEVIDEGVFKRCVFFGAIGFAEAYMAGEWNTPDLTKLIAFFIRNADEAEALQRQERRSTGLFDLFALANKIAHLRRPNSLATSRENIREHYDLSNDFFRLWLDETMTYSSAWFDAPGTPLRDAQIAKYDRLCRKLQLSKRDHVLEIGSGWGGFSIHAASTYGCRITTVTISEQQYEEAVRRIRDVGLSDRVEVLLADYRTLEGTFDKIVSIEMLEAVGDRYVDGYFAKIDSLLKPHGLVALQAILCPDRQYPILRDGVDFIQKHIFPGSLLMCNARIGEAVRRAGDLNLFDYEDMGPHYAKTLRLWCETFERRLDEVRALGFDEVFIRKWRYYLCYCEAAFATRHITVAQIVFSRPDNAGIDSEIYSAP